MRPTSRKIIRGTLWGGTDLRFDAAGQDFVLNRPEYAGCRVLIGGENFGCCSSREHAVWGLLQYGIRAIVAPSFGEIFYSNAMNNQLKPADRVDPGGSSAVCVGAAIMYMECNE
jgi:3-isopropylmalate dehydratase small subunit